MLDSRWPRSGGNEERRVGGCHSQAPLREATAPQLLLVAGCAEKGELPDSLNFQIKPSTQTSLIFKCWQQQIPNIFKTQCSLSQTISATHSLQPANYGDDFKGQATWVIISISAVFAKDWPIMGPNQLPGTLLTALHESSHFELITTDCNIAALPPGWGDKERFVGKFRSKFWESGRSRIWTAFMTFWNRTYFPLMHRAH